MLIAVSIDHIARILVLDGKATRSLGGLMNSRAKPPGRRG